MYTPQDNALLYLVIATTRHFAFKTLPHWEQEDFRELPDNTEHEVSDRLDRVTATLLQLVASGAMAKFDVEGIFDTAQEFTFAKSREREIWNIIETLWHRLEPRLDEAAHDRQEEDGPAY